MADRWAVAVPEGFLELPYAHERPRVLRFEAGLALDGPLRRLSRLSGAVDRALAVRLARLQTTRSYLRLGHARLGDYARERLGLAERTAFDMARLGSALAKLPELDRSLAAGRLTWTAAFQVARVADSDDEAEWVAQASDVPVRELKRRVQQALSERKTRGGTREPSSAKPAPEADGSTHDAGTPERMGRMLMHVSASTALCWHAALDLTRQMAGADLSESEAAEYVLAEFVSGGARLPDDATQFDPPAPVDYPAGSRKAFQLAGRTRRRLPPVAEKLGSHVLDADLARDLDELLRLVEADEISDDPFDLDASMRRLVAARCHVDLDLARLLRNFQSFDLAPHLGFDRFETYVEERLGISPRRARFLVQADRRLYFFPAIREAVRDGRIGMVAALLLTRIAQVDRTEAIWIERARRVTVARLRREVEWADRRRDLRRWHAPIPPPDGPLSTALDELTEQLIAPRQTFAVNGRCAVGGTDSGNAHEIHRGASWARIDRELDARLKPDDAEWVRSLLEARSPDVDVVFWIPESVVALWDEARRQIAFHTGLHFLTNPDVLRWIALDFLATHLPAWLEAVRTQDKIAVRERFRCAIPGCTVYGGAGHHIRFRSRGGSDDEWNLLFVCYRHHILGVHDGHLKVTGKAPDRVQIDLGIRPDGSALESFVNGLRVLPGDEALRVTREDAA